MLKFFSSPLQPDELVTKVKGFVDEEEIDTNSPTLFTGSRPVVGRFDTREFTLQRRVGMRWLLWWLTPGQWFKPHMIGRVTQKDWGSRLELTGGTPLIMKTLWALVFLGASGGITLFGMFSYPYNLSHDPAHAGANFFHAIILLNVMAGILIILPLIGWLQTRFQLAEILRELQQHLELRPAD
ncbi:MAG TPA: hypothetical protein VE860_06840 [Chthoniobacterales bacterium]|jgi:hypothetical protein|nr:hypothetical protein [Chthoniobacterales bacterium]